MARLITALLIFCLPMAASATDEGRFSYLEQEVRNLQRQVSALTRRIDDATRPNRAAVPAEARSSSAPATASMASVWLDAGKWRKLEPGMSELEVVSSLGPPTSMREVDGARVLFYAMELGSSGFLGGSVKFRERVVVEVQQPVLQ